MTKNKDAVELGRKGGFASAKKMSPEQRKERATKAANARWKRHDKKPQKTVPS